MSTSLHTSDAPARRAVVFNSPISLTRDAGTNLYTGTLSELTDYTQSFTCYVYVNAANIYDANTTVNFNSLGAKTLLCDGGNAAPNSLRAEVVYCVNYNVATDQLWIMPIDFKCKTQYNFYAASFNPADSSTYFLLPFPGIAPNTSLLDNRKLKNKIAGSAARAQVVWNCSAGTSESCTLVLHNATAGTSTNITTALNLSAGAGHDTFIIQLPYANNDDMYCTLVTPPFVTNPTSLTLSVIIDTV